MKKYPLLSAIPLLICLCWLSDAVGAQQSEYDVEHPKSDLPPGGEYVAGTTNSTVQYYWTNTAGKMKPNGIYASTDGGATWKLGCWVFQFRKVFVHPKTGVLYAIIDHNWLEKDKDGYLTRCFANKLIMSKDARHWRDISPGPGWIATMLDVFRDPDHSNRVCLLAGEIRPCVFQAGDDEYSTWEMKPPGWEQKTGERK
jgi:hypothetical protein